MENLSLALEIVKTIFGASFLGAIAAKILFHSFSPLSTLASKGRKMARTILRHS